MDSLAQAHIHGPSERPVVAARIAVFQDPPGILYVAQPVLTPEERALPPRIRPRLVGATPFFIDRRTGAIRHYLEVGRDDPLYRLMTDALSARVDPA